MWSHLDHIKFFSVIGQSLPKKKEKRKRSELMMIEHIDPQIPSEKYKLNNSNQIVWIVIFMRWYHFTWVKHHSPMQCPRGSHFHLEKNIMYKFCMARLMCLFMAYINHLFLKKFHRELKKLKKVDKFFFYKKFLKWFTIVFP